MIDAESIRGMVPAIKEAKERRKQRIENIEKNIINAAQNNERSLKLVINEFEDYYIINELKLAGYNVNFVKKITNAVSGIEWITYLVTW